jgi:flagellar motility protein MotE (MotC chaperone)
MTNTNYADTLRKFNADVKNAVSFHNPDFTNSAITRQRIELLQRARTQLAAKLPATPPANPVEERAQIFDRLRPGTADAVAVTQNEWSKVQRLLESGRNFANLIAQADERRLAAIVDQFPTSEFADTPEGDAIVAEVQELAFRRLVELGDAEAVKVSQTEQVAGREAAWDRVLREASTGDVSIEAWQALNTYAPEEAAQAQDEDPLEAANIADKVTHLDHVARTTNLTGAAGAADA